MQTSSVFAVALKKSLDAIEAQEGALKDSVTAIAQGLSEVMSVLEMDLKLPNDLAMPGLPGTNVPAGLRQLGKELSNEIKQLGEELKEQARNHIVWRDRHPYNTTDPIPDQLKILRIYDTSVRRWRS